MAPDIQPDYERGIWLQLSIIAAVEKLGGEVMFLDEADDFAPALVKIACLGRGPHLVLIKRPGDHAKAKPRRFTAYQIDAPAPGQWLRLDPDRVLFVPTKKASTRRWQGPPARYARLWFNQTLTALHAALEPVAACAN
jgi:hypothetical protein